MPNVKRVVEYDGRQVTIEVPDDMSADDIELELDSIYGKPDSGMQAVYNAGDAMARGAQKTIWDIDTGLTELPHRVLPEDIATKYTGHSQADLDRIKAYTEEKFAPVQARNPVSFAFGQVSPTLGASTLPEMFGADYIAEFLKPGTIPERGAAGLSAASTSVLLPMALHGTAGVAEWLRKNTADQADAATKLYGEAAKKIGMPLDLSQLYDVPWMKDAVERIRHTPILGKRQLEKEAVQREAWQKGVFDTAGANKPWELTAPITKETRPLDLEEMYKQTKQTILDGAPRLENNPLALANKSPSRPLLKKKSTELDHYQNVVKKYGSNPEYIPYSLEEAVAKGGDAVTIDGVLSKVKMPRIEASVADEATLNALNDKINIQYNDILGKNTFPVVKGVKDQVAQVGRKYNSNLVGDTKVKVNSLVQDILNLPDGVHLPGSTYQGIKSYIAAEKRIVRNTDSRAYKALIELEDIFKGHMLSNMSEGDAKILKNLDREKANYETVLDAVDKSNQTIDPRKYESAILSRGNRKMLTLGKGFKDPYDLAIVGKKFVRSPDAGKSKMVFADTSPLNLAWRFLSNAPIANQLWKENGVANRLINSKTVHETIPSIVKKYGSPTMSVVHAAGKSVWHNDSNNRKKRKFKLTLGE
jgi:hypothetical protein